MEYQPNYGMANEEMEREDQAIREYRAEQAMREYMDNLLREFEGKRDFEECLIFDLASMFRNLVVLKRDGSE